MEKEANFYTFPKEIEAHVQLIKSLSLDEIVKQGIRLIGVTDSKLENAFYFINPLIDYNMNRSFFCSGLTILDSGSLVSFIVRKGHDKQSPGIRTDGRFYADCVFLIVKRRDN